MNILYSLCLSLFLFLGVGKAYGQLKIDTSNRLIPNLDTVKKFMTNNHFEYAVMAWNLSNWDVSEQVYTTIIRQEGKWYVGQFITSGHIFQMQSARPNMNFKMVDERYANALLKKMKSAVTFSYSQSDLDNLRGKCGYSIMDAGTLHLVLWENNELKTLAYDAPEFYIKNCYPKVDEYKILLPMIHTYNQLQKAAGKSVQQIRSGNK